MRILFLKFGALGDVLMTTPLIRQTRRAFPEAQLDYCVAEPFSVVVRENPHLNDVLSFDPMIFTGKNVSGLIGLIFKLRARKYDLVFVLDKHAVFALLAYLSRIPRRLGFARDRAALLFLHRSIPYGALRHDIHYNLDLLAQMASVDYTDARMEFCRREANIDALRVRFPQLRQPFFTCCNSGGENIRERSGIRRLPRALFAELLSILSTQRLAVLLGNYRDREYYASFDLPPNVLNLGGETTMAECAEVIAHAEEMFTTDCGLMHLAATTDTPLCAFMGPTHPKRLGPLDPKAEILWPDENIYESDYQTRGCVPRHRYYTSLDLGQLRTRLRTVHGS